MTRFRPVPSGPTRAPGVVACLLVLACSWSGSSRLTAQETIAPDRPGIGSASTVISPGIFQLESGVSFSGSGDAEAVSLGQLFLRYGVASSVELELLVNSFVVRRSDIGAGTFDDEGLEDLGFGTKVGVLDTERSTLALQGIVTVATGSDGFSQEEWSTTVNGLLDVVLSEQAILSVNLGVRPGLGDLETVVSANVTPGISLGGGFGAYGGWAGSFMSGSDVHFVEAGATKVLGANVQLDVNSAFAVDTDDWFVGAGFSIRRGATGGA